MFPGRLKGYVPVGFAHGIETLVDDTLVSYKVTSEYSPDHDRSIRWDDPDLNIPWPLKPTTLSKKDAEAPFLKDADNDFERQKAT